MATTTCWDPVTSTDSPVSAIETKVAKTLPATSLDVLRRLFLQAVTTTREPVRSARAVVQIAFESELRVLLVGVPVPPNVLEAQVCTRQKYLDVDKAMQPRAFLYGQALAEAVSKSVISLAYADVIQARLNGSNPKTRATAVAALLVLSASALN